MIEAAASALLSRGVQPDVIESMTAKQLHFWAMRHQDIQKAEEDAMQR